MTEQRLLDISSSEQDTQNRTGRTGQEEQDTQNRTEMTAKEGFQDRTARTELYFFRACFFFVLPSSIFGFWLLMWRKKCGGPTLALFNVNDFKMKAFQFI
jgi:hypothetical protein